MDWIGLFSALAGSGVAVAKSGYFVKTGEVGAITTFGSVKRGNNGKIILLNAGFKLVIPFAQSILKVHTRKNTDNFSGLFITLKNGISYKFNAYVVYHVIDEPDAIENVLFTLDDYKEFVQITFEKAIQQSLEGLTEINNTKINEKLTTLIKPVLRKQGIDVDDCGLISFTATEQSQHLLGLQYKINVAKEAILDNGIMAAILGATPTVVTNNSTQLSATKESENED
jgi:hypothetical protein